MYERLGKMTRFGILDRKVFGNKPPVEVEYHLTPLGHRFMGILSEIRRLQESLERGEIARADTDAPRDDGQADLYGAPS
jgi:DNA-binding HxlR family transcriptional regulator